MSRLHSEWSGILTVKSERNHAGLNRAVDGWRVSINSYWYNLMSGEISRTGCGSVSMVVSYLDRPLDVIAVEKVLLQFDLFFEQLSLLIVSTMKRHTTLLFCFGEIIEQSVKYILLAGCGQNWAKTA